MIIKIQLRGKFFEYYFFEKLTEILTEKKTDKDSIHKGNYRPITIVNIYMTFKCNIHK